MAVNSITFGGVNSADFGIYISGEGVFNAPKRDVEMITIPGRNGAFALDNGRFENIEVTYPAFNFEPNDYDTFMQNLSDFRNAICSQRGYQRLTDTFHPDEYREAVYIGGLEIKPIKYNTASEFNIVFDCKPQRWLTSGEAAVTVASGDTLTNPTLFESSPLLEIEGYGTVDFNGYAVEIDNAVMGDVVLASNYTSPSGGSANTNVSFPITFNENGAMLNSGDAIVIDKIRMIYRVAIASSSTNTITSATITSASNFSDYSSAVTGHGRHGDFNASFNSLSFSFGTPSTSSTATLDVSIGFSYGSAVTRTFSLYVEYDGDQTITLKASGSGATQSFNVSKTAKVETIVGDSSMSMLGHPTYIDCDLGECYLINSGEVVSLNQHIDLGSDLPTLAVGNTEFTLDNTITDLQVIPRWWKV